MRNSRLPIINDGLGKPIPGKSVTLLSAYSVVHEEENSLTYRTEYLNSLSSGAIPDHVIKLKNGVIFMLLKNINTPEGHCNGTRHIFQEMTPTPLDLNVAVGKDKGKTFLLQRIPFQPGSDGFPVPGFSRLLFPIQFCFGVNTNKAQGQSFGAKIGLRLTDACIVLGQLFVGLSRATDPRSVTALNLKAETVKNVVYHEVFRKKQQLRKSLSSLLHGMYYFNLH